MKRSKRLPTGLPGQRWEIWSDIATKALAACDFSMRDFAMKVGARSFGEVQMRLSGNRPPPPYQSLIRWGEVLGLGEKELQRFIYAGMYDRAEPEFRRLVKAKLP